MIRERLLKNKTLVSIYQKLIGYDPNAKHWCRVVMDEETDKLINNLPIASMNAFEISGDKWKSKGFKSYKSAQYPDFDICSTATEEKFDLIIAEQVFEHLLWPYQAAKNVHSMLNPGGYFLISTPFLIRIHNFPVDCSRWTETGLKYFLAECGFELSNTVTGSWGNEDCVVANFYDWMPFNPKKHSLQNNEEFPLVVWALTKR